MSLREDKVQIRVTVEGQQALNELGKLEQETNDLAIANGKLAKEAKEVRKKLGEQSTEYKHLKGQIDANADAITSNNSKAKALRTEFGLTHLTTRQLSRALSDAKREVDQLTHGTDAHTAALHRMQKAQTEMDFRRSSLKPEMARPGFFGNISSQLPAAIAGGIGGGIVAMGGELLSGMLSGIEQKIEKLAKKADDITDLGQAFGVSVDEAKALNSELAKLDNREGPQVLREIMIEAGRLDVPKDQVIAYTEAVGQAAVAMKSDFPEGASVLTQDLTQIKNLYAETKAMDYPKSVYAIGSAMKSLADTGTATAKFQSDFLKRTGQLPETIRPGVASLMGYAAVLEEAGLTSEIASSGLTALLIQSGKNSAGFAKLFGMQKKEFEDWKNAKPVEFLNALAEKMSKMSGTQAAQTLAALKVESQEAFKVLGTLGNSLEKVTQKQDQASKAFSDGTRLTEIYSEKNENLAGKLERAGNKLATWFNNSAFSKLVGEAAEGFADLVLTLDKSERNLDNLTSAAERQADVVRKLDSDIAPLIDRYNVLKSRSSLTKDEQTELKTTIEKVALAIPTAITQFDNYGKALDINAGKARKFISDHQEYLKYLNREKLKVANEDLETARRVYEKTVAAQNNRDADGDIQVYENQQGTGLMGTSSLSLRKATAAEITKIMADRAAAAAKIRGIKQSIAIDSGSNLPKPGSPPTTTNNGLENYDPDDLKKDRGGKSDAEKLAEERIRNEADTLREITRYRIEAIDDETDKKVTALITQRGDEIASKKTLVSEKKLSEATYQAWLKESETKLNDDIATLEGEQYKRKAEAAQKAAERVTEIALNAAKIDAETRLEAAKQSNDRWAEYSASLDVLDAERSLALLKATEDEKANIKAQFRLKEQQLTNQFLDQQVKKSEETAKKDADAHRKAQEQKTQQNEQFSQEAGQFVGALFGIGQAFTERDVQEDQRAKNQKIAALDAQFKRGLLSQEQYDRARNEAELEFEQKSRSIRRRQAEAEKLNAIFQGTIALNTAILKANATAPGFGQALAVFMALTQGALLTKVIATPIPEYAGGGELDFARNPTGYTRPAKGMLAVVGESGREYVVNNAMLQVPWIADMVGTMDAFRTRGSATSTATTNGANGGDNAATAALLAGALMQVSQTMQAVRDRLDEPIEGVWDWERHRRGLETMAGIEREARVTRK